MVGSTYARGIRPLRLATVGAIYAGVIASLFVLTSGGWLPGPWPGIALWVLAGTLALWAWALLIARRVIPATNRPTGTEVMIYVLTGFVVLGAMRFSYTILEELDRTDLWPPILLAVIGIHFLPFAPVFSAPVFVPLGVILLVIGIAGAAAGAFVPVASPASATTGGLLVLIVTAYDAVAT